MQGSIALSWNEVCMVTEVSSLFAHVQNIPLHLGWAWASPTLAGLHWFDCVIWRYHLWAAYPCLSWSAVAMRALTCVCWFVAIYQKFELNEQIHKFAHVLKVWAESLGLMSVDCAWPLPEANSATVRDLTVPSVNSLPLSVMVHSCYACVNLNCLRSRLLLCWHCAPAGSPTSIVTKQ